VVLFGPPQEGHDRLATDYLPAMVSHPVDTVGAGDLFLATVSLARSAGAASAAGAYLGSCVSALGVRQIGNDPVERTDLDAWLDGRPELNAAP
jgi:sugar/nucleoside kinase (ribokinase family)